MTDLYVDFFWEKDTVIPGETVTASPNPHKSWQSVSFQQQFIYRIFILYFPIRVIRYSTDVNRQVVDESFPKNHCNTSLHLQKSKSITVYEQIQKKS